MNYGLVARPQLALRPESSGENAIALGPSPAAGAGETVAVPLILRGAGDARALSVELDYDAAIVEPIAVEPGALLALQPLGAIVLSARPGNVDLTLLGRGGGIAGEGEVARVTLRVKSEGAAGLAIRTASARDGSNHPVAIRIEAALEAAPPAIPARTALGLVAPNPFSASASVELMLARPCPVRLEVYDLGGRRVRTLVDGVGEAGTRHVVWDGKGESGARVPAGVYLMRLEAGGVHQVRRVQVIR
ncbi:MAG TPA: FlgD immunoglobulin-like domain containing protein, partial [Candidatus Eisenbacteria bacterium]